MNNIITWKKYIVKASFAAREGFLDLFSKNFRSPESNDETKYRSGIGFRLREFWRSYPKIRLQHFGKMRENGVPIRNAANIRYTRGKIREKFPKTGNTIIQIPGSINLDLISSRCKNWGVFRGVWIYFSSKIFRNY